MAAGEAATPRFATVVARARSAGGLILFTYVLTHLTNHALGLVSLDAMEAGRVWFVALWRNPVGITLLYGALAVHFLAVAVILQQRRSWRLPAWQWTQVLLGISLPFLLVEHVIGTRYMHQVHGFDDRYAYVVHVLWNLAPEKGVQQTVALLAVWVHGCVGLHFWWRLRATYRRLLPILFAGAILLPALALLGFAQAGREVAALLPDDATASHSPYGSDASDATGSLYGGGTASSDVYGGAYGGGSGAAYGGGGAYGGDGAYGAGASGIAMPGPAAGAGAARLREQAFALLTALLIVLVLLRLLRGVAERRRPQARVAYGHVGRGVATAQGTTLLEVSRRHAVPHASVCGGRGRCSTCRVRVSAGAESLSDPMEDEHRVLARIGAPDNVRLACQARVQGDVEVTPLLPAASGPSAAGGRPGYVQGREQEIAVLFADLRGFTRLSENKLPYDVVFILNRYFAAMGAAVEAADGRLDKFIGDGVMALFGIDRGVEDGCVRALAAAVEMGRRLEDLNRELAHDLDAPLRIGIGIHAGPAIVGQMGYGEAAAITAIGDTVNVASRLEAASKEFAAELVLSADLAARAGIDTGGLTGHEVALRGRREPLAVFAVARAKTVADLLPPGATRPV